MALRARGEEVIGCDAGATGELIAAAERLAAAGVEVRLDASTDALAATTGTLVKSPGVPQSAPLVREARRRGIGVVGELELAWRMLPNDFVAVTGTNGKTTTTEWIGHIYRTAGRETVVAGNVGTALSGLVGKISPETTVICEASSFQLEDTEAFRPDAAVLLNLSPDHLDRHGSFDSYVDAKLQIFARQTPADIAVLADDLTVAVPGHARQIRFGHGETAELAAREIRLPGAHNLQNAAAAATVTLARGIPVDAVAEGLRTFAGVPHRLELVAIRDGVSYVNDSKATNVASTIVALRSYPSGVHLIAGGIGKEQDFSPLAPLVAERCAAVYLIGRDAGQLEAALSDTGVTLHRLADLPEAVRMAGQRAGQDAVVLLSPACASFDQYRNFEARGDHFRALVAELDSKSDG
jgi:UDP-N-acetylmuramoylalanine--D-glutamate ligase